MLLALALTSVLLLHVSSGPADSQHRLYRFGDAAKGAMPHVALAVQRSHPGDEFALGAVGLSIEARELGTPDLSAGDRSLVALMRLLGPGVLRIGGLSLDLSWWTSHGEPAPGWATNTVVPADLVRLRGLLSATGWRAILGVDLGHFDPRRAADEAQVAERVLGSRVLGFEIGNEPRDYGSPQVGLRPASYSVENYLEELTAYNAAMRAAVPAIHLYGPDLGRLSPETWLWPIASDARASFASIDVHYYPTHYSIASGACEGSPAPTATELLSPEVREHESSTLQVVAKAGELAHRRVLISETNDTSSCDVPGGPETSPVFASALWSLDWTLRAASAGTVGIDFHGYLGRCRPESFAPICEPRNVRAASERVAARPEYYGLLAARQLEGGRFVSARLISSAALPNLTAWATVARDGTISVALENFATAGPAQPVSIPAAGYVTSYEALAGPSIEARGGVTLGGADVTRAGRWQPRRVLLPCARRSCTVAVHPASAVILTLRPRRPKRSHHR